MVPRSQVGGQCSHSSFLTEIANPHSDQSGCGSIMRECSVVTARVQLHLGPASDEYKALFAVSHFFVITARVRMPLCFRIGWYKIELLIEKSSVWFCTDRFGRIKQWSGVSGVRDNRVRLYFSQNSVWRNILVSWNRCMSSKSSSSYDEQNGVWPKSWPTYDLQVLITGWQSPFCDGQKTIVWTRPYTARFLLTVINLYRVLFFFGAHKKISLIKLTLANTVVQFILRNSTFEKSYSFLKIFPKNYPKL